MPKYVIRFHHPIDRELKARIKAYFGLTGETVNGFASCRLTDPDKAAHLKRGEGLGYFRIFAVEPD